MDNNKIHKVITCAGYGCTGSSVVTDLLKEYSNCHSLGDYEFRFIQDYEGISSLQYHLVDHPHRLNCDIAINRFKKIIDYHSGNFLFPRYQKFFNNEFKKTSYEYLNSLIEYSWRGYWEHHAIEKDGITRFFLYKIYPRLKKPFSFNRPKSAVLQPPKRTMYFSNLTEEKFYDLTKKYTNKLLDSVDKDYKHEFLILDQLVPSNNLDRYANYFYDIKVIVVDRDPRDIFALNELLWNESWIPSHNVDLYIDWFKALRRHLATEIDDPNRVLRVKFEDVVTNYDEYINKFESFLGLDSSNHINKRKYFNPEISINNIGVYKKYPNQDSIKKIEEKLNEYCFTKVNTHIKAKESELF